MSLPRWTHKKWCRPSDPINIVFRGISIDEVINYLKSQNWKRMEGIESLISSQYIPNPSVLMKKVQDVQLKCGRLYRRYHIRLWDVQEQLNRFDNWNGQDKIVAGIHLDSLRMPGVHITPDFETIEDDFASICLTNPEWNVMRNNLNLDNFFGGYGQASNNGMATIIEKR